MIQTGLRRADPRAMSGETGFEAYDDRAPTSAFLRRTTRRVAIEAEQTGDDAFCPILPYAMDP